MAEDSKSLLKVLPLFLVLFIDGMGLGLLFPILNSIIVDPSSAFLSASVGVGMREFLYGLTIGIFMICWFFGAAILGDLSDTVGRKKSLLICLVGAFIGYFIAAIAIIIKSLPLLIFGRVIAGFTAGSQPIAQAAIVDVSTAEHKARNIGLILLAVSLGFVFGPIFGGVLSDKSIVSWFTFATPFYFASSISLLNAFLLLWFFKETFHVTGKVHIRLHHAINIFISAFRHHKVRNLSVVLLIMISGWSSFFSFISLFLFRRYHFTALQNSLLLAVMGLGFSIGCGYLVEKLAKRYALKNSVIVGLFVSAVCSLLVIFVDKVQYMWLISFVIGISMAVAYSMIITMFSNQVDASEQGWVMGVTGAIMALCFGVTSFFTGAIAQLGIGLPMIIAAVGLGASGVLLCFVKNS